MKTGNFVCDPVEKFRPDFSVHSGIDKKPGCVCSLKKRPIPHKHGIPSDSQSSGGIPFVKIVDLSRRRQSEASDSGACHATPMRSFFLYWLGERPSPRLKTLEK